MLRRKVDLQVNNTRQMKCIFLSPIILINIKTFWTSRRSSSPFYFAMSSHHRHVMGGDGTVRSKLWWKGNSSMTRKTLLSKSLSDPTKRLVSSSSTNLSTKAKHDSACPSPQVKTQTCCCTRSLFVWDWIYC